MTRSRRMRPVQQVAESREQAAVKRLGKSQQQLAAQQTRLQDLCEYRRQYTEQFSQRSSAGLDPQQVCDYRAFLTRLNEAIRQQELLIEQCRNQHAQHRDQWIDSHSHAQAVDKLIARFRKDEQKRQQKREQHALDEHAARAQRRDPK